MARRMVSDSQIRAISDKSASAAASEVASKGLCADYVDGLGIEYNTSGVGVGKALREWLTNNRFVITFKSTSAEGVTFAILHYDKNTYDNIADDATPNETTITGSIVWGFKVNHYETPTGYSNITQQDLTGGTWEMKFSAEQPWYTGYGYWHITTLNPKAS